MTGGIAHNFNNLLTVITGSVDLLRRPSLTEAKQRRYIDAIAQTAERAAALTSQLLAFGRRQPLQPRIIDLNARLRIMTQDRVLGSACQVILDLDEGLCAVEVDPTQLEVAILNIASNARDAMPQGGAVTIVTSMSKDGERIDLAISDAGSGMDAETLARATEPFFTTKPQGKGTGLGLSQVYGFAAQTGGKVEIESQPGRGATIRLSLPCSKAVPAAEQEQAAGGAEGWRGTILFVEDNADVAAFSETLLQELGHLVICAASAEAALAIVHDGVSFDLVFTDVVMPGLSGLDLAREIEHRRPGTPVILATGYSDRISEHGSGGLPVLRKPYTFEGLAAAISAAGLANGHQ